MIGTQILLYQCRNSKAHASVVNDGPPIKLMKSQTYSLQWDCILDLTDMANVFFLLSVFDLSFFHF